MRSTTVDRAREFAEAMLDAVEMVEETHEAVGVLFDDILGRAYATTRFTPGATDLTIYPSDTVT